MNIRKANQATGSEQIRHFFRTDIRTGDTYLSDPDTPPKGHCKNIVC